MIAMPVVRHGHAVALLQLVGIHLSIERPRCAN